MAELTAEQKRVREEFLGRCMRGELQEINRQSQSLAPAPRVVQAPLFSEPEPTREPLPVVEKVAYPANAPRRFKRQGQ